MRNKNLILGVFVLLISNLAYTYSDTVWVDGYYRKDGTHVEGHYKTKPNSVKWDNLYSDGVDTDGDGYGARKPNRLYDRDNDRVYDGFNWGKRN